MTLDETYAVTLTRAEACYLSDAIPMHMLGPPDQEITGRPYPQLLLQVGSAFLELRDPVKCSAITLNLTEAELWVIREVAKMSVTVGTERVGLNLLAKVYEGLLKLNNQKAFDAPLTDKEEPLDKVAGLAKLNKRVDYNEGRRRRRREKKDAATD